MWSCKNLQVLAASLANFLQIDHACRVRPKLSEIATRASVSEATVSRVLNAKPGVADATRRRVLDVITDLGYADTAQRGVGSGAIGIVTPELSNPFFPHLARQIMSVLSHHGYVSLLCSSTTETVHEQDYLDMLVTQRASGVVVVNGRYALPEVGYAPYQRIVDQGVPVVLVNGFDEPPPLPSVTVDVRGAAEHATSHLRSLGHERIGLVVGPTKYPTASMFVEGYARGLGDLALEDLVIETPWTVEGGQAAAAHLLERGVTGVVCANDLIAVGVIHAARTWGASVPDDISVIGFDGSPLASMTDPPLATLRQPAASMASSIAAMLIGDHRDSSIVPAQMFRAELVMGGTTTARARAVTRG